MRRALALLCFACAAVLVGCGAPEAEPAHGAGEIRVRVGSLAVDTASNSPVVILEEMEGARTLPIWIGLGEARSIAAELEREHPIRPNTHDLAKRLVDRLDGVVERVVVTELNGGIYYALIVLRAGERTLQVDARPSDAIALALRYGAPVFVAESLFETAAGGDGAGSGEGQRIGGFAPDAGADRQVPPLAL